MTDRELLQQALDVLEDVFEVNDWTTYNKTIEAIRTRLAQPEPEPEPVAKVVLTETIGLPCLQWLDLTRQFDFKGGEFLYTAPPQREWQGLTYKERCELWNIASKFSPESVIMHDFAKDIEQALREKNA